MSSLYFFATRDDLLSLFAEVERRLDIVSYPAFVLPADQAKGAFRQYEAISDVPGLSTVNGKTREDGVSLIVAFRDTPISPAPWPYREEPHVYTSATRHEDAVSLIPGGVTPNGTHIIRGTVENPLVSKRSGQIMRAIRKETKRIFRGPIRRMWVGPGAYDLMLSGLILNDSLFANPEMAITAAESQN
ncbi:MAG: hypothetical protein WBG95_10485 [Sulfitobacter sp.]